MNLGPLQHQIPGFVRTGNMSSFAPLFLVICQLSDVINQSIGLPAVAGGNEACSLLPFPMTSMGDSLASVGAIQL